MTLFSASGSSRAPRLAPYQEGAVAWLTDAIARRGGALLADATGLGKSWVAAAVARNWEEQGGSVAIIVPASLVEQWREVAATFGLRAEVESHDGRLAALCAASEPSRLLIVDEAHRFRNPRTRRYRRLALAGRRDACLLITATPVCNAPGDLRALLGLLVADDALADRGVASLDEAFRAGDLRQLRTVMDELAVAREANVLPEELRFSSGELQQIVYEPAGGIREELDAAIGRLRFPLVSPEAGPMLRPFLWRRLESSGAALGATLRRLRRWHVRALECLTRGVALSRAGLRAAFGDPDAPVFQDVLFPELWGSRRGVRYPMPPRCGWRSRRSTPLWHP